jgi:hypothetical protein
MATRSSGWTGWIVFAGWLMVILGSIDFLEGLIAVIRKEYYAFGPNQIIIFDMTTWGWLTLLWGIVLFIAGFGLLSGASWARWFTIVAVTVNVLGQLAWVGNAAYPLWALAVLALSIVVLYALTVRWSEAEPDLGPTV